MKFMKGMLIGTMVSAGIAMMYFLGGGVTGKVDDFRWTD